MANWALLSYQITPLITAVTLTATTSAPAHLFAHWTTIEPKMDLLPRIRRGLELFCYPTWAYQSQGYIEQVEPGETLDHTFEFPSWPLCTTRWLLISAQTDLSIKASSSPIIKYHNPYPTSPLITYCRPSSCYLGCDPPSQIYLVAHDSLTGYVGYGVTLHSFGQMITGGWYWVFRIGMFFDNPHISPSAIIQSITLHFLTGISPTSGLTYVLLSGADLEEPLVPANYHDLLDDTIPYGTTPSLGYNTWHALSLNALAISMFQKNAINKYALRSAHDISATPPISGAFAQVRLAGFYPAYLEIVFTP